MRIIHPDGLFTGDRFKDVTDEARLFWPFFWCASNGYGRIELNPHKVIGRAFSAFRSPPTEERFWSLIGEYHDAFLLFVYEAAGQLWGQWATSEKYLPRHKRSEDERSPSPDPMELDQWREAYISRKRTKSNTSSVRGNFAEKLLQRRREISAPGVRVLSCIEESCVEERKTNTCASDDARDGSFPSIDDPPFDNLPVSEKPAQPDPKANLTAEQTVWFGEFWGEYWLLKAKKAAQAAFAKHVRTPERFHEVMAGVRAQKSEMLEKEASKRPYAATWLNGERWNDDVLSDAQGTRAPGPSKLNGVFSDYEEIKPTKRPQEAA